MRYLTVDKVDDACAGKRHARMKASGLLPVKKPACRRVWPMASEKVRETACLSQDMMGWTMTGGDNTLRSLIYFLLATSSLAVPLRPRDKALDL